MIQSWEQLKSRCYVPYSRLTDVCVCVSESGTLFPGIRVENASYPLTIAPDQLSISLCLMYGHTPKTIISPEPLSAIGLAKLADFPFEISSSLPSGEWFKPFVTREFEIQQLSELRKHCVIQESGFPVTAMIATSGGWVAGTNVEYTYWGMGLCAERMALATSLVLGFEILGDIRIKVFKGGYASPCGACRQVLSEFSPKCRVSTNQTDGNSSVLGLNDLLPYAFISKNLEKNP